MRFRPLAPRARIVPVVVLSAVAVAAFGCGRSRGEDATGGAASQPPPTFSKDIAPVLFRECAGCHRPGQSAPFTVLHYEDVRKHAGEIAEAVTERHMPPWLPAPGFGEFVGERRLDNNQIATVQRWVKEGAVEGQRADLPPLPTFTDGWQLGTPDLVVTAPRPYTLGSGKQDLFRNLVFPVALPAGRFVRAVEFRPGNTAVVHHAVISIDRTRASRRRDGADGQPGYDGMITQGAQSPDGHFLGWTPGRGPIEAPPGMPWRLAAGSDLVVQLHLLPQDTPSTVQPSVGLFFTDTPPARTPVMVKLSSKAIDIPAGERAFTISDAYVLPVDVDLLSVYPHAHYLGKEMHAQAFLPDGTTRWLLRIDEWNFHWQQDYRYATPVALPRGTRLTMRYTYDNSEGNPHRPDGPLGAVVYGPNSSDEMGDLWLQVLPRSSADAAVLARAFAEREARVNVEGAEFVSRRRPDDAKNRAFLGSSYIEVGRVAEAIPHLQRAISLDPRSANAHNYLGAALLSQGRVQEAITYLKKAAALSPDDERMHFNLGNALNAAGAADDAARAYRRALAINPDFADAHDNLGVFLESRNQMAQALWHLTRAVELAPESAPARNDLGAALANAGRIEEALVQVRRAIELRPDYAPARQNLAILEQRRAR